MSSTNIMRKVFIGIVITCFLLIFCWLNFQRGNTGEDIHDQLRPGFAASSKSDLKQGLASKEKKDQFSESDGLSSFALREPVSLQEWEYRRDFRRWILESPDIDLEKIWGYIEKSGLSNHDDWTLKNFLVAAVASHGEEESAISFIWSRFGEGSLRENLLSSVFGAGSSQFKNLIQLSENFSFSDSERTAVLNGISSNLARQNTDQLTLLLETSEAGFQTIAIQRALGIRFIRGDFEALAVSIDSMDPKEINHFLLTTVPEIHPDKAFEFFELVESDKVVLKGLSPDQNDKIRNMVVGILVERQPEKLLILALDGESTFASQDLRNMTLNWASRDSASFESALEGKFHEAPKSIKKEISYALASESILQKNFEAAQVWINSLENGREREELQKRLDELALTD